jgi:hypothetical protein
MPSATADSPWMPISSCLMVTRVPNRRVGRDHGYAGGFVGGRDHVLGGGPHDVVPPGEASVARARGWSMGSMPPAQPGSGVRYHPGIAPGSRSASRRASFHPAVSAPPPAVSTTAVRAGTGRAVARSA